MKHDVFVVTGGQPLYFSLEHAQQVVGAGQGEWIGTRKIKLKPAGSVEKARWQPRKSGKSGPVVMQLE